MTKKSFFERLTGATKEEIFQTKLKAEPEQETTRVKAKTSKKIVEERTKTTNGTSAAKNRMASGRRRPVNA